MRGHIKLQRVPSPLRRQRRDRIVFRTCIRMKTHQKQIYRTEDIGMFPPSRLFQSRSLQVNTHFISFCSIFQGLQDYHSFAPLQIQYVSKFSSESFANFQNFVEILLFFIMFIEFCTDFDEILSEFLEDARKCQKSLIT